LYWRGHIRLHKQKWEKIDQVSWLIEERDEWIFKNRSKIDYAKFKEDKTFTKEKSVSFTSVWGVKVGLLDKHSQLYDA